MAELSPPLNSVAPRAEEIPIPQELTGRRTSALREGTVKALLYGCAALTVVTTLLIIFSLFGEALGFFGHSEITLLGFLTGTKWQPLAEPVASENFGVLPLINGTLLTAVLSGMIALPLGVGSAIYLSEYARPTVRSMLKPALEVLAGIPSVVYGYFALSLITPLLRSLTAWLNSTLGTTIRVDFFNAASASIVMGIMILPLVASISEDAMRAVPQSLREAAYGLGATKFEAATRVVVPAALSGIVAGFILAFSRAIGETMVVAIAAGSTPRMTLNPLQSIQTMTGFIVQVSFGDNPVGSLSSQAIFAVGAALFAITFVMNIISNTILRIFREEYR